MKVHVEDFLEGRLAISEEQVDAFATKIRATQRPPELVCYLPYSRSSTGIQVLQPNSVEPGNDQEMSLGHRLEIHERQYRLVRMDNTGLRLSPSDGAEHTAPNAHC